MIHNYIYTILTFVLIISIGSCRDDDGSFDNKLYNTTAKTGTIFLKSGGQTEDERKIEASITQPVSFEVIVNYKADPSLVSQYNIAYEDNAKMLPSDNFEIPEPTDIIAVGNTASKGIIVKFKKLDLLDSDSVYVLPVTIESANLDILNSARTTYYIFRGSALINVVPDMERNYFYPQGYKWKKPEVLSGLSSITLEALVNVRSFDKSNAVTSIMGIEGYFLIRVGDIPIKRNQIEVVTPSMNFHGPESGIVSNKWVHIAVTYQRGGQAAIYVDGKPHGQPESVYGGTITFSDGKDGFYIGRSYDDSRYLEGSISECRIWNVIRTQEEIAANIYGVEPTTEGLVAYWKCDEGQGRIIKDHTQNGNDLESAEAIVWNNVSLPEKE